MCVQHIPSPVDNARLKVQHIYTGPLDTVLAEDMCNCDPDVSTHVLSVVIVSKRSHEILLKFTECHIVVINTSVLYSWSSGI
jgi:hypothetical protein